MKKIALALENFSRLGGGAESYAVSLASTLVRKGWEVHLFGQRWDGEPREAIFHRIKIPRFLPSWTKMILFALKHRKMARQNSYDVVLGFGNSIYMNVYQSHGGVHRFSTARKIYAEPSMIRRLVKRMIGAVSVKHWVRHWIESAPFRLEKRPKIVAISQMIRDDMESFFHIENGQIEVIYNGVDTRRFNSELLQLRRGPLRRRFGINEKDVAFLFISFDLKKKGILPLAEASASLARRHGGKFKVIVVGGLPYPSLSRRIAKLRLTDTIIFSGPTQSPEDYYANCDVLVLPTYYDACSLVVFEAMASGLPVITTVCNGAAGILTDGKDGYVLCHPPEPMELAQRMDALMSREMREKMGRESIQTSRRYTIERNHEKMIDVFNAVASGNSN